MNYRGTNYRGRSNQEHSLGFGRGHGARSNHRVNNSHPGKSFHTTLIESNMSSSNENTVTNKNEIKWLLDSGCTDHIINTDEYFEKQITLKDPIKVKVGDGRMLEATKIGNIIVSFPVYKTDSIVTLKNVFYVKGMKANLLSYSKITDNHKIVSKSILKNL